ncbi:MAG: hypothetical protein EXR79_16170 [Myxococcales bacterium]|nr:hypothetical protein [Myxococcales bacterium]
MNRTIRAGLVGCALAACSVDDASPPAPPPEAHWGVDHVVANAALASVWGAAPNDVWAAGGTADRGLLLHNDGARWEEYKVAAPGFLWWVYGVTGSDVYAAGASGVLLHFDGNGWSRLASGTTKTLYGVWAKSADEVWLVGGDPWGQPGGAVVLRGNSKVGFRDAEVPAALRPEAFFKVYGTPAGDVVAVGSGGAVVRFGGASHGDATGRRGGTWQRDTVPTSGNLVSLWGGGGERLYAVGGQGAGELLHFDGTRWAQVGGVQAGLELYGVYTAPGQPLFAVGAGPRIVELAAGSWAPVERDTPELDSSMVLHSVWGDGAGTVYAVGGTLYGGAAGMRGVVLARR